MRGSDIGHRGIHLILSNRRLLKQLRLDSEDRSNLRTTARYRTHRNRHLHRKSFVVERKTEKADSDEQFEDLFCELVDEADLDRLVLFVDELDRCAPAEIVSTLDAVRTFLGVDKCIFIVATDQQVLEQALTKSLSQATPADPTNPYYSAGSAYLDKVFQYQVSIPPLLPQSVTRFAADLRDLGHQVSRTSQLVQLAPMV
ncbi:MAG: hypothetical protein HOY78_42110 [Saccharothrix sp.]|nr:hypothetical protein [Saccharothrix sp.]